jgi:hypothetical protein
MSFALYVIGYIIVIIGLIWGAHMAHVPERWIMVSAIVLVGLGIITGVKNTRQKDPAA